MKIKILKLITFLLLGFYLIIQTKTADINRGQMTVLSYGIKQVTLLNRKIESKKLADYMYERIKEYQKYKNRYDKTYILWYNWEELQKEN